jgi:nitroreductase
MDSSPTLVRSCVDGSSAPASRNEGPAAAPRAPLPLPKTVKWFVKQRLFDFCEGLESLSALIQKKILRLTLAENRAERTLQLPVQGLDQDLLAMHIRWQGHHVEKAVRYKREEGSKRGEGPAGLLRFALDEWYRRGYPQRAFIQWAEGNLADFKRWVETNEPQLHPEKELPVFNQQSPVWEVLTNRVSTRFWHPVPVEDEKISQILQAATYAPTSCNRQTWKLYVRKNRDLNRNSIISGVSNPMLRTKAPVAIYITIDNRLYPEIWAPAEDAGIVGLQLSLAATSLGLAGCLMYGAEKFDQESFRKEFGAPPYRFMYLMYLFGYPAERTLTTKRAHPDDIAIFV